MVRGFHPMSDSKINIKFGWDLFITLLIILFLYLKLTNQIGWSWWWVLSPVWIPVIIVIFIFLIGVMAWLLEKLLIK